MRYDFGQWPVGRSRYLPCQVDRLGSWRSVCPKRCAKDRHCHSKYQRTMSPSLNSKHPFAQVTSCKLTAVLRLRFCWIQKVEIDIYFPAESLVNTGHTSNRWGVKSLSCVAFRFSHKHWHNLVPRNRPLVVKACSGCRIGLDQGLVLGHT